MKKLILVAEDSPDETFFLQEALTRAGLLARAKFLTDGQEVVHYLKGCGTRQNPVPRLMLLDLKMPKLNGFQVLDWISGQPNLKTFPVIILTTSDMEADLIRAYRSGASSCLVKPTGIANLVVLVEKIRGYWLETNHVPISC